MFESIITCFYLFAAVTIDLEFNQNHINLILRASVSKLVPMGHSCFPTK